MAKYTYDKTPLKGLGVGAFLGEVKVREKHIAEAEAVMPQALFNANFLAEALHPAVQHTIIKKVIERKDAKSFVFAPNKEKGTKKLAFFRAGQYVSVKLNIGDTVVNKPYSICSGPADALDKEESTYMLTIKRNKVGFASDYILDNWKEGMEVDMSGPLGEFYYTKLRDAKNVIALAGGSGITPFYSMASAIADGIEDFNLTILYGSRTIADILLKKELDEIAARSKGKVKLVYILSDETTEGYEHGFIASDVIKKYAAKLDDYTVFICGPKPMYNFLDKEFPKLGLKNRRIRKEVQGEYGDPTKDADYPQEAAGKTFQITVRYRNQVKIVPCKAEQSLLQAMEFGGVHAPSECRSGECGWCHSRLIKGKTYIPKSADGRRAADIKFNWIHPCCTFALSDIELEVPVIE